MLTTRRTLPLLCVPLLAAFYGCGKSEDPMLQAEGPCAAAGITQSSRFEGGSPDGHPDPLGAATRGKARASRIRDKSWIRQPENAREKVQEGDFLLINDHIAVYIEAGKTSDGYQGLAGDILAIEPVGADGKPSGTSQFNETFVALSGQAVGPDEITVLNDGQDGKAAIVRVSGALRDIPFLRTFAGILGNPTNLPAALDYVLEPGAENVVLRLSLMNTEAQEIDFNNTQIFGFFQGSRSERFTPESGFAEPSSAVSWLGFTSDESSFAFRLKGRQVGYIIEQSGFEAYRGSGLKIGACEKKTVDYIEWIPATGGIDALRAAVRRVDGDNTWHPLSGKVQDDGMTPIPSAFVHAVDSKGQFLTRAKTDAAGEFILNVPSGSPVDLTVTVDAHTVSPKQRVTPTDADHDPVTLTLPRPGRLHVVAKDSGSGKPLPVRIEIAPVAPRQGTPDSWGVHGFPNNRSVMAWSATGDETYTLPVGAHHVIVSHGPEWEMLDTMVTIESGKEAMVNATLLHSVDSTGVMCGDFHIHSYFSADSADPVPKKVISAVADGLEIPVSSEHEWIIDFQPVLKKLRLDDWAFGMSSEELTTFTWGHFGVVPITPRPERANNGAVPWLGKSPREVFADVHALPEKPVLIVNHPTSSGFGGYFSAAGFERSTVTGDPELWSEDFDAIEAFNDSDLDSNRKGIIADWFALLNAGKRTWAVGSSDTHSIIWSPVGYPRTCMRIGHDDPKRLTPELVRDTLRAGKSVITGGLYLTVEGPDGVGPGETVRSASSMLDFHIVVQSPTWIVARQLEVIVNGETERTVELMETVVPSGHRYEATVTLKRPAKPQNWVVFHARPPAGRDLSPVYPGRKPFAVSNPIFF